MSVTWATPKWHECDTSKTRATRVGHEWGTSATQVRHKWKILILITTRMRTYFHTPMFIIWQMKDYKQKNNFILRTTFWKNLALIQKCVWKMRYKSWTLYPAETRRRFNVVCLLSNGKSCIKNWYTRL